MAETEVKPSEPVKAAGDKKVDTAGKPSEPGKQQKGGFWAKYKWWVVGGLLTVLVIFYLLSRSSGNASTQSAQQTAAQNGIDPATGYLYGSPADLASLGGSGSVSATPGPGGTNGSAGATGPAGPTGPRGATGAPGAGAHQGYVPITFGQAKDIAGKRGSSSLFYTSGGKITQGKYANDKNVQYYVKQSYSGRLL